MIIEWNGKGYNYDPRAIDVATAMVIREHTGWGLKTFSARIDEWDPLAAQLLMWAMKRQNGEPCDPMSLEFSVPEFMDAVQSAALEEMARQLAAEEAKAKAEPKRPKARSPRAKSPRSTSTRTPT